jgi:hypothetical protein
MTTTLPLQLARRPKDPPIATPEARQSANSTTTTTSKSKKSRAPAASTSKRKLTKAAVEVVAPPAYEQFGNLPANPSYHLARTAHAIRTARNIIVISGAGVSTPAIPDFRSSRGLFRTLADDAERKGMYDAELEDRVTERSAVAPTGTQSGMKSGKELFDVKCLTVSHRGITAVYSATTAACAVSGPITTPSCASQSSLAPYASHSTNTVSPLPQNPGFARPPAAVLYAKYRWP